MRTRFRNMLRAQKRCSRYRVQDGAVEHGVLHPQGRVVLPRCCRTKPQESRADAGNAVTIAPQQRSPDTRERGNLTSRAFELCNSACLPVSRPEDRTTYI